MYLFATDLDNTLIHSYKRAHENDICVETKDGKELSFMTPGAYYMLEKIYNSKDIIIVPVTTRSLEQYNRIDLFKGRYAQLALAANGGILIENGVINKEWSDKSRQMISDCLPDFERGISYLKKDQNVYFEIRIVDELFVFTKSSEPLKTKEYLEKKLDSCRVNVYNIGDKVYIFPDILSKGMAIKRLRDYVGFEKIICAGDSEFDVPMLNEADFAYCPDTIADEVKNRNLKSFDVNTVRLADQLLSEIEERNFL